MIEEHLAKLGIRLPVPPSPAGSYVSVAVDRDHVHVSGHGPMDGSKIITGKVGLDLTLEEGRDAARMAGLSILASLERELGSLDRIEQIVKVMGMVNAAPGFTAIPDVINGCSDLLVEVFGDAGRHARSAVGMAELPFGIAVEIDMVARIRD